MAKASGAAAATSVPENQPNLPTTATQNAPNAPSAELAAMFEQDKGKGVSKDQADNLVPLVYILQAMSPQVQRRNGAFIEGAEPGAFWLRHAPTPIVSGEEGVLAQPCYFVKDFVEWRPRESGGGFVRRHTSIPPDANEAVDPRNENRIRYTRPNGNEIIETRSHVCRLKLPDGSIMPYIIPFTSTGHTTSRSWMFMMNTHDPAPGFARWYRLTSREKTNALGTWFGIEVKDEGWATPDEYRAGRALHDAFASGAQRAEDPLESTQNPAAGGGQRQNMGDEIPF